MARYGPEHYHRLNPAVNALGAAGMLRFTDRSHRVLLHTTRNSYNICDPNPAYFTGCTRASATRIYDYTHTVEVIPTAVQGVEWTDDAGAEPQAHSFAHSGVELTPGWVVDLGRRELVDVRQVRELDERRMEVAYTWRWALTPTGRHFDTEGDGAVARLVAAGLRDSRRDGWAPRRHRLQRQGDAQPQRRHLEGHPPGPLALGGGPPPASPRLVHPLPQTAREGV